MTGTAILSRVANVSIPSSDQDAMLRFYTETLGFDKHADLPLARATNWIDVAPTRR